MRSRILLIGLILLSGWILSDLLITRKRSLRDFDARAVARLDTEMWRSYYEHKRVKLFWQLSRLMREQFHAPFWRSFGMAYRAAKAATVFQDGRNRRDYVLALPHLEKYFHQIGMLSMETFDGGSVAANELEWWIIRRDPAYRPAEWEKYLAAVSAEMYSMPAEQFAEYARLRVEAMVLRDSLGQEITEADWVRIGTKLEEAWGSMYQAVRIME